MHRAPPHPARWILAGLLAAMVCTGWAHGQVMRIRASGLQVEGVVWGFDDQRASSAMPAECFAPVTGAVSSGAVSVQGILTLEYPQDASQNALVVAPFATTPTTTS